MSLDASEFDKFADEYLATHARNVAISGEAPEYFAAYKIQALARRWAALGLPAPAHVLDFGCGVGASIPHLRKAFPAAEITGLDVSARSLAIAEQAHGRIARFRAYDGEAPDLPANSCDLIFTSCVFHHIPAEAHPRIFAQLRGLLRPGGVLAVFEHNPLNPVTRYIVATCPFDENAVLIGASELKRLQRQAGFARVEIVYTGFFPRSLKALRPLEPHLGWLPIGAQYFTLARG